LKGLPDPAFTRRFLILGGAAWILIRAALFFAGDAVKDALGPPTLTLAYPASLAVASICGGLVVLNVFRLKERLLLANLGVPLGIVGAIGAIPALIAETLIGMSSMLAG
jgi:nitrate/nitrite transporter NarK